MATAKKVAVNSIVEPGRQEVILDAALRLFTAKGYFNASVHDIRREADVSIGSIYHHFKNKEGVARALYERLVEQVNQVVEEAVARHATTHDRCREVMARFFELTEASPATMQYVLYNRYQEFMPDAQSICLRPFQIMRQAVDEGIAAGEIRSMDPVVAVAAIFGGALRIIGLRLDGILPIPVPEYLDEVWACAWRSVAPPGDQRRR